MATDSSKNTASTKNDDNKSTAGTAKNNTGQTDTKSVASDKKAEKTPTTPTTITKADETVKTTTSGISPDVYDSIEFTREQLLTSSFNDTEMLMIKMLTRTGRTYTRPQIRQLFADFKKKGLF
ncbi:hypothetical protein FE410_05290 [Leuconostoc carnosum]|uniref:hypothetical protein n=1 Tax=Leuconostoc TaxID=1243 RepID=UPI00123AF832|nr:hypothetical protein [Leuconostoc carnosum]KAA8371105.1 hypothetical protein FE414_05285 [Leuconostoc carnosum]KAA8382746.1 hypothetical protein FE410_05290 [Leuconostoc carnosum]